MATDCVSGCGEAGGEVGSEAEGKVRGEVRGVTGNEVGDVAGVRDKAGGEAGDETSDVDGSEAEGIIEVWGVGTKREAMFGKTPADDLEIEEVIWAVDIREAFPSLFGIIIGYCRGSIS